ncbi:MAG TPA: 4-hydroxythreonine-4-phosphate dehydrogenase PdxA [Rhodocyclaceae bacterium]|nr:4-hydroxythreonine-4-phosphate dehydrogenase PdxA [Rhodocyclaceae bacterium]
MSPAALPRIAITSGEPAGIGPELCLRLSQRKFAGRLVVLGDRDLLAERARTLGFAGRLVDYAARGAATDSTELADPDALAVLHVPRARPAIAGRLDPANGRSVLAILDRALAGCRSGEFAAMVTAPLHKGVINDAGVPFTGHTEYLAEQTATPKVVMMLVGGSPFQLKVALVTTHLPLRAVPDAITAAEVENTLRIVHADLQKKWGIAAPRILVAGLNPHAGEGGYLGREEIDVIAPVIEKLRGAGLDVVGPLPADTLFTERCLAGSDAQVAMYHDQGLAVLKHASFGAGVNVTLGLPIIRTSVDHGTALDLAGTGRADPGSLFEAIELAIEMAQRAGKEKHG